jgi:hypothetical protein
LNVVCERINSVLSSHKKLLLDVCQLLDRHDAGRLTYEQFRLSKKMCSLIKTIQLILFSIIVIRDRLPKMSREDLFVLTKLFEIEGFIDYRAILDDQLGNGILQHITQLTVPPPKQIVLEKKSSKEVERPFNEPLQLNHPK